MTIVVLDAYTLNPGDLDWASIETLGAVSIYDRTEPNQLSERAADAEAVLVNKFVLTREGLAQLPRLRYIGVTATGYNNVDLDAARERGIVVTNVKGYSTDSVAQLTFALLLELTLHVGRHDQSVHAGDWVACADFSYAKSPLVELAGKTLGIVGYGDIGQKVAAIGQAFGMKILVNRQHPDQQPPAGIHYVDLSRLFEESDVITLHCPMTEANKGFVNKALLSRMRPSAYLINTSRGGLITEADLAEALNEQQLAGAGLDVLSLEPARADNPLLTAKNCLLTPHIAWASFEARQRLMQLVADNLRAFQLGNPQNRVS